MINSKSKTLIPETVKKTYLSLLNPVVNFVVELNMHPNTLSFIGFFIIFISVSFIVFGYLHISAGLMLVAGIFDNIDGHAARKSNKSSRFGALLDSALDRASEFFFLAGAGYYFITTGMYATAVAAVFAVCLSFLVSYIRARAEGLGFTCDVGFIQREERVVLLGVSGVLHQTFFILVIWFIAFSSLLTVIQRLRDIWEKDKKE
ncbi:MAG: CDP-alcohol phosphatidyltransferase family protein [bacterium]